MENYAAIKERLLRQVPKDGQTSWAWTTITAARIFTALSASGASATPVSVGKVLGRGVFVVDGALYDAQNQRASKVMGVDEAPRLPGAHYWQNMALAYAASKLFVKEPILHRQF